MRKKRIFNGLTVKRKKFVDEYVKSGNGTQAALSAYNTTDKMTAAAISSELLKSPNVQQTIEQALQVSGYKTSDSIDTLTYIQRSGKDKKLSAGDSIRATELLLKLENKLVDRKQVNKLNINLDTTDKVKLLELRNKYNKLLNMNK